MKIISIIKISSIFIPIILVVLILSNKQSKNDLRNFVRIIKQEITEPSIKHKNRMPTLFDNIYTYLDFIFTLKKYIVSIDKIKNFKVLSNSKSEFYTLYDEIFMGKLYYFETNEKKPFIIDCGSNIGMSVLFFKLLYPDSEILAFEPSTKNFDLLRKNIKNNNLENIKLFKKALADKLSSIKLYGAGTPLGSIIKDNPHNPQNPQNYELVETTLLSDYINKKVNLLKIDTEGSEYLILKELDSKNKLNLVDKIIMEYHHFTTQNSLAKLLKILEKNDFAYQICSDQHPPIEYRLAQHFFIYAYKTPFKTPLLQ